MYVCDKHFWMHLLPDPILCIIREWYTCMTEHLSGHRLGATIGQVLIARF